MTASAVQAEEPVDAETRRALQSAAREAVVANRGAASISGLVSDLGLWEFDAATQRLMARLLFEAEASEGVLSDLLDVVAGRVLLGPDRWADGSIAVIHPWAASAAFRPEGDGSGSLDGIIVGDVHSMQQLIFATGVASPALCVVSGSVLAQVQPVFTADSGRHMWRVRAALGQTDIQPYDGGLAADVQSAQRLVELAVATYLLGLSAYLLDVAREHVLDRHQFGRPLAVFQAVKHHLAHVKVRNTAAAGVLELAWSDPAAPPELALAARGLAGVAFEQAHRRCTQVMGGMGYSLEHPAAARNQLGLALREIGGTRALSVWHDRGATRYPEAGRSA